MANGLRWKIAQGFEIRWWKGYLKKKDPASYAVWKRAYWQEYLDKMGAAVSLKEGDRILDAGCGPSGIFVVLESFRPDALDPLIDAYEAVPHFKKAMYPGVRFFAETLEEFRPEVPYDTVFCMNAINHVDDLAAAYDTLARLTKPGGTLVVTIDAHNHGFFKRLFRLIPGDILHPHQFDEPEYAAMLTARGFTIVNTQVMEKEFFFSRVMQIAKKN
jgi:2-polyprenyl-3-methyl-5-hydroxy-6-metoxy-1,4-benzoquinol methylase